VAQSCVTLPKVIMFWPATEAACPTSFLSVV